jgi:hypothetical protein
LRNRDHQVVRKQLLSGRASALVFPLELRSREIKLRHVVLQPGVRVVALGFAFLVGQLQGVAHGHDDELKMGAADGLRRHPVNSSKRSVVRDDAA